MNLYYKINRKTSGKYITCISNYGINLDYDQILILLRTIKQSLKCNGFCDIDEDNNLTILLSGNRKNYIDNNLKELILHLFGLNLIPVNI